ncbi:hypothetical protein RAA17_04645 [Komagataeibacter rhaeticus]|nr:hypothetical protein [Komagataeibacter rhaeticus]
MGRPARLPIAPPPSPGSLPVTMQHMIPFPIRRPAIRPILRGLALPGLIACALAGTGTDARAQVTTSQSALDALGAPPKHPAMLPSGASLSASQGDTDATGPRTDIPGSHAPATAIASPRRLPPSPVAAQPPANPVLRPPELHVPEHPFPRPKSGPTRRPVAGRKG